MALAGIPTNLNVQQGNRQVFLSWDLAAGATSYSVQRSLDGVTYSVYATPTNNSYLDIAVVVGTQYFYQVASVNGSGTSAYTTPQSTVPTPTSEMSLGEIRLRAQQRADRVNSNFVSTTEWNSYINQSMYELYDLLIGADEEYFVAVPAYFATNGQAGYQYPLPDGLTPFTNLNGSVLIADPLYRLKGIDLGLNFNQNAFITVRKYPFMDRNKVVYPNTSSTIYSYFNLRYRMLGNKLQFVPDPTSGQPMRIWYIPRLPQMMQDTDLSVTSISGWLEYVIVDAAIKALQKEESDTSLLMQQKQALKDRIESMAMNRDAGEPDKISDIRSQSDGGWGWGTGGPMAGW